MRKSTICVLVGVLSLMLICNSVLAETGFFPDIQMEANQPEKAQNSPDFDTRMMAYFVNPESGVNDRAAYFGQVAANVSTYRGATAQPDSYEWKTKAEMKAAIQSAYIVFIHSHGASGCITIGPSASTYIYNYDFATENLGQQLCIILLTCNGGSYVAPPSSNMVQAMVNAGATCVVGFSNTISVQNSNDFAKKFSAYTMSGFGSVAGSINYMATYGLSPIAQYAVVGGTGSTWLN